MTKQLRYCVECKHSRPDPKFEWNLRCFSPVVNANDAWALASTKPLSGTECRTEREGGIFYKCGKRGAQWEPKP